MPMDLIYDKEANVWVYTGKVFTVSEQIMKFKETYADYKNHAEWRELLKAFMFHKQHDWAELIASSEQFADVVENLHMNILYGKKLRIKDSLNQLVVIAGLLNKTKEKNNG